MREHEDPIGPAPTADELEAARRLADALEKRRTEAPAVEGLAVARLLEPVTAAGAGDDLASRRLRKELVDVASRRPARQFARFTLPLTAAIAVAVLLAALLRHVPGRPSAEVLVAREEAARAAAIAVAGSWGDEDESSRRIAAVSEQQWRSRLAGLLAAGRVETLATGNPKASAVERGQAPPRTTRSVPTPGGPS